MVNRNNSLLYIYWISSLIFITLIRTFPFCKQWEMTLRKRVILTLPHHVTSIKLFCVSLSIKVTLLESYTGETRMYSYCFLLGFIPVCKIYKYKMVYIFLPICNGKPNLVIIYATCIFKKCWVLCWGCTYMGGLEFSNHLTNSRCLWKT